MEIRNPMKTTPESESASALELQEELKIREQEDEEINTDNSEKNNEKRKTKPGIKKRREVTSDSVRFMYESDFKFKKALRNTQDRINQKQVDTLKEKVKQGFQTQLKNELLQKNNTKAAAYIQDRVALKSKSLEKTNREHAIQDKESLEQLKKQAKTKTKKHKQQQLLLQRPDIQLPLKEYIATYGETLLRKSPEKKQKLEKLQQTLQKEGLHTRDLRHIEKGTQAIVRTDLKKMLKRNFTKLALSFEKRPTFELLTNYTSYYSMLETAKSLKLFDAEPGGLNKLKENTKRDVANFLTGELDRSVVETKLETTSINKLKDLFTKFNGMADFSNFNAAAYMKTFQQKLDNEGLKPFIAPYALGPIDSDTPDQRNHQSSSKNPQDQEPESDPSFEEGSEEELEQALLNLYIKAHSIHTFTASIKHKLTIRKREKASQATTLNCKKLKRQAHAIAHLRARMKCRSLFEQRATFPELKGPTYNAFKKELKHTLKTLKKLGHPMDKKDLEELKHQSNRSLFSFIKEEYIKNEIFLEAQPNHIGLLNKKKTLQLTINRLMSETKINEKLTNKLMEDLHFLNDVTINEAA